MSRHKISSKRYLFSFIAETRTVFSMREKLSIGIEGGGAGFFLG